ncbi:Thrombospondin type-1 domain-containing protein 7A [Holothuria leucospilota]|uniref:Thrombospondin type-1 domain-containing protein 7A n=1 Tax=Holothuria leucospilota TaxID=206669 RepID=A0A9Q1C0N6_HOLLE|nr:Thrombospondin type-1 domain-containing protein 7A [Holothuria leucospilota]
MKIGSRAHFLWPIQGVLLFIVHVTVGQTDFVWRTGSWGECQGSSDCGLSGLSGSNKQTRAVWCEDSNGVTTQEGNCDPSSIPHKERTCFRVCSEHHYLFQWTVGPWGPCERQSEVGSPTSGFLECGPASLGLKHRTVTCNEKSTHFIQKQGELSIPDSICEKFWRKPSISRDCLMPCSQDCVVSEFTEWNDCTQTCGNATKTRSRSVIVAPNEHGANCPPLSETIACQDLPLCPSGDNFEYVLKVEMWGACTVTSTATDGNPPVGRMTRELRCIRNDGEIVDNSLCIDENDILPERSKPCIPSVDCVMSEWSLWSSCPNVCQLPYGSTTDNSNTQRFRTRTVVEVPSGRGRLCDELVQYQSCTEVEASLFPEEAGLDCQSGEYVWFTSEWSPCEVPESNSDSCGGGVQTRHVFCIRSSDTEHLPMPSNLCDISLLPDIHQSCSVPCPVDCVVSLWAAWDHCQANECENPGVKKAKGYRTRERQVIIPASSGGEACPHLYENAPCTVPACYTWKLGRVGECRPTDTELNCGEGLLTRDIQCLDSNLKPVNTSWCKALYETPMWEVPCYHPCPNDCVISEWGQWSPCSLTCTGKNQGGLQVRQKVILAQAGPGGQPCPGESELMETRRCNDHSCALFAWQTDEWGECVLDTASQARGCGTGVQTRTVECDRVMPRKDAPIQRCKPELEPPSTRACEVPCPVPCKVSEFTAWSECPTECDGSGSWLFSQVRTRYILQHPQHSGASCPAGFQEERVCSAPESCHTYQWVPSSWSSECEIGDGSGNRLSCGDGLRTRELICQRGDGRLVAKDLCLKYGPTQPLVSIPCNIPCEDDCQFNPWSLWSHCASCSSKQTRSRSLHGASKNNPKCLNKLLYPTMENRTCHCPVYRPQFIASKSDCIINEIDESPETGISAMELDCGRGTHFQAVQCQDGDGRVVPLAFCAEDSAVKEESCGVPCPTDCHIGDWTTWGSCMTEDGAHHGIQTRRRELMPPQFGGRPCPLEADDVLYEVQTRPCWPESDYHQMVRWFAGNWEECIVTGGNPCGLGAKSRTVSCLKIDAGGFTTNVSSELCPQESKPEARRPCTKPCDGQCVVSEWTEWIGCPRNCSSAVFRKRHRDILRHPSPDNEGCPHLTESQPCMLGIHCFQYFWNTSRWSSCILGDNAECGSGQRIRLLTCVTSTGTEVENDLCEEHASNAKPNITEPCSIECPLDCKMSHWSVWSLCPKTCGMHRFQTRSRTILQHPNSRGRPCPVALTQSKPCEPVPCYTFRYSEWGACIPKGECGSGLRHRYVTCHQPNGVEVEFDLCLKFSSSLYDSNTNITQKGYELLQREEECQIPCPGECQRGDWSQWSACHIHCANGRPMETQGIQVRSRASLTQRADCPDDDWDTRTCQETICFEFMWQTGPWDEGLREVWCQRSDGINVTGGCSQRNKPNVVAFCTGGCPVENSFCEMNELCSCRKQYKPMYSQESGKLAECVFENASNKEDKELIPSGPTKQPSGTENGNKGELGDNMFPFDFLTILVLGTAAVVICVMVIVVCAICCCCSKKSSNKKNDDKLPQPQYRDYSNSFWDENAKMKYTGEIDL